MITRVPLDREDILAFDVSGTVTDADYREVVMASIDAAAERFDRVRVVCRFTEDFESYSLKALLDDARVGLKHWRGFDRIAIVTDNPWVKTAVRAASVFVPCPVQIFALSEYEDARRWLVESLGAIHQTDLGDGVLHVQLMGQLDAAVYAEETEDLNAYLRAHERARLLIDLREFDGWQGLGAVGEHLKVVRDHHQQVDRIALVGTNAFERLAQRLASRFLAAESRYFDEARFDEARAWLTA